MFLRDYNNNNALKIDIKQKVISCRKPSTNSYNSRKTLYVVGRLPPYRLAIMDIERGNADKRYVESTKQLTGPFEREIMT
jgi:hypothetical protein